MAYYHFLITVYHSIDFVKLFIFSDKDFFLTPSARLPTIIQIYTKRLSHNPLYLIRHHLIKTPIIGLRCSSAGMAGHNCRLF